MWPLLSHKMPGALKQLKLIKTKKQRFIYSIAHTPIFKSNCRHTKVQSNANAEQVKKKKNDGHVTVERTTGAVLLSLRDLRISKT